MLDFDGPCRLINALHVGKEDKSLTAAGAELGNKTVISRNPVTTGFNCNRFL